MKRWGIRLLKLGYKIVPEQFQEMNKCRLLKCRLIVCVVFVGLYPMTGGVMAEDTQNGPESGIVT